MSYSQVVTPNSAQWLVTATAAAAAAVTATKAAVTGVIHVARRLIYTATPGSGTAATTGLVILLDGTTVIAQWAVTYLMTPATATGPSQAQTVIDAVDLHFPNTAGNLMTATTAALNSTTAAATPAGVSGAINLYGYDA